MVSKGAARNARELAGVCSQRRAHGGRVSGERGEAERKWTRPLCAGRLVDVMRPLGADERGHRRRTDDIWWTGVDRDIHAGELSSESKLVITD